MLLVSACLLGVNCKYNGSNNLSQDVLEFIKDKGSFFVCSVETALRGIRPLTVVQDRKRIVVCCPELLGGLSIPRGPYEITGGSGKDIAAGNAKVISKTGADVTTEFLEGAKKTLRIAKQNRVKLAILKARSPSCGVNQIYDGTFSGTLIEGDGVTAALLRKEGIELISDEEIN